MKKRYVETIKKAKVSVAVAEVPGCSTKGKVQKSDLFRRVWRC